MMINPVAIMVFLFCLQAGLYGPIGFKLAYHHPGVITNPDEIDRDPAPEDESTLFMRCINSFLAPMYPHR